MFHDSSASENEILQAFNTLIPYLPDLFEEEILIGITDRLRFLKFVPSKTLNLQITAGDVIPPGDAIYEAMRLGQPVVKILPAELYGAEFRAVGVPVRDVNGRIIGGIGIGRRV